MAGRRDNHRTGSSEASLLLSTTAVDLWCLRPREKVHSWQLRQLHATQPHATCHAAPMSTPPAALDGRCSPPSRTSAVSIGSLSPPQETA